MHEPTTTDAVAAPPGGDDLQDRLAAVAESPVLLVASDYDGTIAPIVADPNDARPLRESVVALRMLAEMPRTHVALVSGRALEHLAALSSLPETVHLVGSHGSEFDRGFAESLDDDARRRLEHVAHVLGEEADAHEGFGLEAKPASVAFHYRNTPEHLGRAAIERIESGVACTEGVWTRHGKSVIELSVIETSKGTALDTIRHRCGATAVVFLGDDVTDEDAFSTLRGADVGVKVGDGDTIAPFRVADSQEVARVLACIAELRARWLEGARAVPIEAHTLLSDQRSLALVTPDARVCWLSAPRLDAEPVFAELLGGPSAGHFTVRSADGCGPRDQSCDEDGLAVTTRFDTFEVTDFLDVSDGRTRRRPGRTDLVRIVRGRGRVVIEFAPRLDFGRVMTNLQRRDDGLEITGTADPIVLRAPGIDWTITTEGTHQHAAGAVDLDPGRPLVLELRYGTASLRPSSQSAQERRQLSELHWSSWLGRIRPAQRHEGAVRRGALLLKALCHGPTGAIAAAATTSLPEHLGGVRNWDYRYCWIRDAAMSAATLVRWGSTGEAMQFLDWLLGVLDETPAPERLQPLYDVAGQRLGAEAEIPELAGYAGSRPVRVGNAAARQVQLDVFGPVVDLVALLLECEAPVSAEHWRLVEAMVSAVAARWREPDHGIWEIRGAPRHHVHSRCMCWLTVTRGLEVAGRMLDRDQPEWRALAAAIRADVLEHGYDDVGGAFTSNYGSQALDAASLAVGLTGLVAHDDPRFEATVAAIESELRDGPTVYRYRADGLPGAEGGFHLCAGWLAQSYILLGRLDEARELLDGIVACAGATGSLAEQIDPATGRALGNVPQAYSHLAVMDTVRALEQAGGA